MLIKDVLADLEQPGETLSGIAKRIEGMGGKRLKKALNQAGYTYRNKTPKGWSFSGEGDGPLDHKLHSIR